MFFRKQSAFGIADYVMAFSISLITKSDQWPEFLMLSGFFGIALAIIKRQRKIPFCIAMFLASTILLIFCMLQA